MWMDHGHAAVVSEEFELEKVHVHLAEPEQTKQDELGITMRRTPFSHLTPADALSQSLP